MFSLNKISKFTGFGYSIIFITGFFANFFVLETMINPFDASVTLNNIIENEMLFRFGILGFVIMVVMDLLLAWTLYLLLKPVDKNLSLLSSFFRLVNASIFGIALYNLISVIKVIKTPMLFGEELLAAQVHLMLDSFNTIWFVGLIFFGFHLILLGYLIYKSYYIHKLFGVLLVIAGGAYLVDSFANILLLNYNDYKDLFAMVVIIPAVIGELALTIRLIFFNVFILEEN